MREIKFRAWDGKEIIDWNTLMDFQAEHIFTPDIEVWELMQYTGLKDKNGVEVYEGDVVKGEDITGLHNSIIEFENGRFIAVGLNWGSTQNMIESFKNLEVIGNIWQNSELLANK